MSRYPRLYRVLRYCAAATGWLVYCYEWVHVSWQTPRREPVFFLILFLLSALTIQLGIIAWIDHNRRRAINGKRGLCTRYIVPSFSRDYLGREITLHDACRLSREIIVRIEGAGKIYIPAPEME